METFTSTRHIVSTRAVTRNGGLELVTDVLGSNSRILPFKKKVECMFSSLFYFYVPPSLS